MSESNKTFLDHVHDFVVKSKMKGSFVENIKQSLPEKDKKDIDNQLETFEADMKKMTEGSFGSYFLSR